MSRICCGACHIKLEDDEIIVMDEINTLKHKGCYDLEPENIKDIDTYKNIKEKYDFFCEQIYH